MANQWDNPNLECIVSIFEPLKKLLAKWLDIYIENTLKGFQIHQPTASLQVDNATTSEL